MINTADYHREKFKLTQALGAKLNAGDASFQPVGYGGIYLLVKQFPHPVISGGAEIEVPHAGGGAYWEQAPVRTNFQGPLTLLETEVGTAQEFVEAVIAGGGYFDARIYEGTPQRHLRSYMAERCFFNIDPPDRDWENRQQVLMLNGTVFFHYFGKKFPGNA